MRPASQLFELAGQRDEGCPNVARALTHVTDALGDVRDRFELASDRRVPPLELRRKREELCVGACHELILQMRTRGDGVRTLGR